MSGTVCFMNNKTPGYLTYLTEERYNLIEQAVTEKKEYIQWYQEMKHKMKEQKIALMEERKQKVYQIPALNQKDAVIAQIKYHKFVLETKPYDNTHLQLQSGKEKFRYEQLVTNLEKVLISFSP